MTRIIVTKEKSPVEVKIGNESKWICMCGLSSKKPFCDGAHKQTKDEEEGKVYSYENGKKEVRVQEL